MTLLAIGEPLTARGLMGYCDRLVKITTADALASVITRYRAEEWYPIAVHNVGNLGARKTHTYGVKAWMLEDKPGTSKIAVHNERWDEMTEQVLIDAQRIDAIKDLVDNLQAEAEAYVVEGDYCDHRCDWCGMCTDEV